MGRVGKVGSTGGAKQFTQVLPLVSSQAPCSISASPRKLIKLLFTLAVWMLWDEETVYFGKVRVICN